LKRKENENGEERKSKREEGREENGEKVIKGKRRRGIARTREKGKGRCKGEG